MILGNSNTDRLKKEISHRQQVSSYPSLQNLKSANHQSISSDSKHIINIPDLNNSDDSISLRLSTSSSNRRTSATTFTTSSSGLSKSTSTASPKRLFEKSTSADEGPAMVTTAAFNYTNDINDNYIPSIPLPDSLSLFNNKGIDKDDCLQSDEGFFEDFSKSDIFLPISVQAFNIDLDNVLHRALISTIDNRQDHLETMSMTSSTFSKVLSEDPMDDDPNYINDSVKTSNQQRPMRSTQRQKSFSKLTLRVKNMARRFNSLQA
jgi:hypothetical protein